MARRSHRSFVSYIDRSRDYYAAQGYEHAYQWATHDTVHFARPAKPLGASRVGVVTTSFFNRGTEPPGVPAMPPKQAYAAPTGAAHGPMFTQDLFWAKDETHTEDLGTYLPLGHLDGLAQEGTIGSVSERFYGVPTSYSSRQTREQDGPMIAGWMADDGVDLALLVGL